MTVNLHFLKKYWDCIWQKWIYITYSKSVTRMRSLKSLRYCIKAVFCGDDGQLNSWLAYVSAEAEGRRAVSCWDAKDENLLSVTDSINSSWDVYVLSYRFTNWRRRKGGGFFIRNNIIPDALSYSSSPLWKRRTWKLQNNTVTGYTEWRTITELMFFEIMFLEWQIVFTW